METSPLLRFRRAQTTNERMSVAITSYGAGDWSDDESATPGPSPLYSTRFEDYLDYEGTLNSVYLILQFVSKYADRKELV